MRIIKVSLVQIAVDDRNERPMKSRYLDVMHPLRLERSAESLGTLEVLYVDQPIFVCSFTPAPAYEEVRPWFEENARLSAQFEQNVTPGTFDALIIPVESSTARIKVLGLRVVATNGWTEDFVLRINGTRARFRYGDCTITDG
jgi:hypothetical protein